MAKGIATTLMFVLILGCGPDQSPDESSSTPEDQLFPDVVEASASIELGGTYAFKVTISSPYDSATRYADAWRVKSADGTVYGIRELLHDHASEQPFTRSLAGVSIPEGIDSVIIEGRDLVSGWGGRTVAVDLPDRG